MADATGSSAASRGANPMRQREVPAFTRPGLANIIPYILVSRGSASRFIEFLKTAFEGTELLRVPRKDGSLMHADIRVGNSTIELSDADEQHAPAPATVHLYVNDPEAAYRQALSAGAKSIYPVGQHPSGDLQGCVKDEFGNVWYLAKVQGWDPGPDGPLSVQPYLHLRGAQKMLPFAEKAFGAQTQGVAWSDDRKILHATIQVGHATFEIDEASEEWPPMPCHLHMYVPAVDTCYANALAAGGTSASAPVDQTYGERSAAIVDLFGNTWYVATYTG